ncbi:hypothetical protein TNCV_80641 [Trichonephila clavipes]|nr:hypothetical protein TNCV_80641 [Trichonephila clavipes]
MVKRPRLVKWLIAGVECLVKKVEHVEDESQRASLLIHERKHDCKREGYNVSVQACNGVKVASPLRIGHAQTHRILDDVLSCRRVSENLTLD